LFRARAGRPPAACRRALAKDFAGAGYGTLEPGRLAAANSARHAARPADGDAAPRLRTQPAILNATEIDELQPWNVSLPSRTAPAWLRIHIAASAGRGITPQASPPQFRIAKYIAVTLRYLSLCQTDKI